MIKIHIKINKSKKISLIEKSFKSFLGKWQGNFILVTLLAFKKTSIM